MMREIRPIRWMATASAGVLVIVAYIYAAVMTFTLNIGAGIIFVIPVLIVGGIWGAVTGAFMKLALMDEADHNLKFGRILRYGFGGASAMFLAAIVPMMLLALPNWSTVAQYGTMIYVLIAYPLIIAYIAVSILSGVYAWRVVGQGGHKSKRKNEEISGQHERLTSDVDVDISFPVSEQVQSDSISAN